MLNETSLKPLKFYRYIDDIWGLWEHGEQSLLEFNVLANQIHPNIKTEIRYSKDHLQFLDVSTKIEHGCIINDLFTKPTNNHNYLHEKSCHPNYCKKGIAYGLGIRAKRICTNETDYNINKK